jgi:hypothetical protein
MAAVAVVRRAEQLLEAAALAVEALDRCKGSTLLTERPTPAAAAAERPKAPAETADQAL